MTAVPNFGACRAPSKPEHKGQVVETRHVDRELALKAFWSNHPLCDLYATANGYWLDGQYHRARSWSLRQLINFAEALPANIIATLAGTSEASHQDDAVMRATQTAGSR